MRLILTMSLALPIGVALAQPGPARPLVEEFRIDGIEQEFNRIFAVYPLRNGNVILRHSGDFSALLFSPSGELIKRFAHQGSGPGEVQRIYGMGMMGDQLWIADGAQNRLTLFAPDGSVARSQVITGSVDWARLRPDAKGAFMTRVMPRALLPGNVALGSPGTIASALTNGTVTSIPLVRMTWNDDSARIVAEMPVRVASFEIRAGDRTIYGVQPFRSTPVLEISPNGRHVVVVDAVEEPRPVIHIVRLSDRGDTARTADVAYVPAPIASRSVDSAVKAIAKGLRLEKNESPVRAAVKVPKHHFPVEEVLVGNDGSVWLRSHATKGQFTWMVVSPAGRVVETLTVPSTTDLQWIDGTIWGVSRDADDVPSVVRLVRK